MLVLKRVFMYENVGGMKNTCALESWRCSGDHILLVGLSSSFGFVHLYDYNTGTGEFKELVEKRVYHDEKNPRKIQRVGDESYYTGRMGTVMKLSLSFE